MAEIRPIDANTLKKSMFSYYGCVNEHTSKSTYNGETLMDYEVADLIEDCIDNAPTVDAVPVVHGRWKKTNTKYRFWCSVCCCAMPIRTNFCPFCGAKMDGGNENEAR